MFVGSHAIDALREPGEDISLVAQAAIIYGIVCLPMRKRDGESVQYPEKQPYNKISRLYQSTIVIAHVESLQSLNLNPTPKAQKPKSPKSQHPKP